MAGKVRGKSHESYYSRAKSAKIWETNRLRRLKRALKRNPENTEQIAKAMLNIKYRRKTPTTKVWSATKRRIAELFKKFTGKVPKVALESTTVDETYWQKLNAVKPGFVIKDKYKQQGSMFALGLRART